MVFTLDQYILEHLQTSNQLVHETKLSGTTRDINL